MIITPIQSPSQKPLQTTAPAATRFSGRVDPPRDSFKTAETPPKRTWGEFLSQAAAYAAGGVGLMVFARPLVVIVERLAIVGIELWPLTLTGIVAGSATAAYYYVKNKKAAPKELTLEEQKQLFQNLLKDLEVQSKKNAEVTARTLQDLKREYGELQEHLAEYARLNAEHDQLGDQATNQQIVDLDLQRQRVELWQKTVDDLTIQANADKEWDDLFETALKEMAFSYEKGQKEIENLQRNARALQKKELYDSLGKRDNGKASEEMERIRQACEQQKQEIKAVLEEAAVMHELMKQDSADASTKLRVASRIQKRMDAKADKTAEEASSGETKSSAIERLLKEQAQKPKAESAKSQGDKKL